MSVCVLNFLIDLWGVPGNEPALWLPKLHIELTRSGAFRLVWSYGIEKNCFEILNDLEVKIWAGGYSSVFFFSSMLTALGLIPGIPSSDKHICKHTKEKGQYYPKIYIAVWLPLTPVTIFPFPSSLFRLDLNSPWSFCL